MEQLVVVTHPAPLRIEARELEHEDTPDGNVALGYYHDGRILARGVVTGAAVEAIYGLLDEPVSVALAATEDDDGNIEGRVCLVLPFDPEQAEGGGEDEGSEPWRASVPGPPADIGLSYGGEQQAADGPRMALLPIGHVVRALRDRHHRTVEGDVREMLDNLVSGRARDSVSKAIDDLLDTI